MLLQIDTREQQLIAVINELILTVPAFKDINIDVMQMPLGDIIIFDDVVIFQGAIMLSSPIQFNHLILQVIAGRRPPENNPENLFFALKSSFYSNTGEKCRTKRPGQSIT